MKVYLGGPINGCTDEGDKADIHKCDVLLMNCPKPSYGTAMEILYGFERGKRVVAVLPRGSTPSPWVVFHAEVHYGSAADVATAAIL